MLFQEPVQAAIWDALNHYDYADALFLAERLYAEVSNDEAHYLLATCYYRMGKPQQTYMLLQTRGSLSAEGSYLLARCCFDLTKYAEAEITLIGNIVTKLKTFDEIKTEFGSIASHVFSLLGAIYSKSDRTEKAVECYKESLKLNPLLWSSYERLCQLGEKVDPSSVFPIPTESCTNMVLKNTKKAHIAQTVTPKIVAEVISPVIEIPPSPQIQQAPSSTPQTQQPGGLGQKLNLIESVLDAPHTPHTPENCVGNIHDQLMDSITQAPRSTRKPRFHSMETGPLHLSPSFGILAMDTPIQEACSVQKLNFTNYVTPPLQVQEALNESKAPRKPNTRRTNQSQTLMPKVPPLNLAGNTRDVNTNSNVQNNPPNVRRSSRLFGSNSNSSSVKENNKQQSKSRFTSPKAVGRKSKTRLGKSKQELNDISKGEIISDSKPVSIENKPEVQLAQMQQQSLEGILSLLQSIGRAYLALSQYNCSKAVELFSDLPAHQRNTGWTLCQIGKAFFEMQNYHCAERTFLEILRNEPYHLEGMEIYSTVLWHLQKEVELSALAHELTEMDKMSAEAWCATGNCFSLQQEHDTAIKFFQRAIQVNPEFAYAYTLLGHEYIYTEELDKAMTCFRNAIRVDPRHYIGWYGIGLIYYKQDKFTLAEVHFRRALKINPESTTLLCHIGVVLHAQQKSDQALTILNKAIQSDPKNPLCKFHRASILFSKDRYQDALEDLEELKQIIPKESLIYFLLGKVHKKMGNTHLALMNFSWATDLDPKGLNNHIKEAIDKRYVTEDEDSLVQLYETGAPEGPGSGSNSSLIDPDDILQAAESDESL